MDYKDILKMYEGLTPMEKTYFIRQNKKYLKVVEYNVSDILGRYSEKELLAALESGNIEDGEFPLDYVSINRQAVSSWYDDYLRQIQ